MKKITIEHIKNLKNSSHSFATLTAYDYISAQIIDSANIPLILVGDSASMTIYGYDTTIPISMDEILLITRAVSRGVKRSLVVADMPFLSYQTSVEDAVKNAGILIKEGGAGAVKIEGGTQVSKHTQTLVNFGIPVLGHVGLTPQSFHQLSGYKIQGKTLEDAQKIIDDANAVEDSGAFAVVLECIPQELAEDITGRLTIPTIGIGSGKKCDGQIQVFHDVIGFSKETAPKHAQTYDNMYAKISSIIGQYKADVEDTNV